MNRIEFFASLTAAKGGGEIQAHDARPAWLRELQRAQQVASPAKSSKVGGLVARPAGEGPRAASETQPGTEPVAAAHRAPPIGGAGTGSPRFRPEIAANLVDQVREAIALDGARSVAAAPGSVSVASPREAARLFAPSLTPDAHAATTEAPMVAILTGEPSIEEAQPATPPRLRGFAAPSEPFAQRLMHAHAEGRDVQVWIRDAALEGSALQGLTSGIVAALSEDGKRLTALMVNGRTVYKQGR